MECGRMRISFDPFNTLIGGHIEMDEHAEAQLQEVRLARFERCLRGRSI
jgi:hypothetical protein